MTASPMRAALPWSRAEAALLDRCGPQLASILRGIGDAGELLFPGGDLGAATSLYAESPGSRLMNRLLTEALAEIVASVPPERELRILEVGAGTGGTTGGILSMLDPAEQGFGDRRFDIVVAVNVLHATRDLRATLGRLRRLCAPGAVLLIIEGDARLEWIDLTFGLTEGWWRLEDTALRGGYPLVPGTTWARLLTEIGFDGATDLVPGTGVPVRSSLMLAKAPLAPSGPILLLADAGGTADATARRLAQDGAEPVLVRRGATFERLGAREYQIDPYDPGHYAAVLRDMVQGRPTRISYMPGASTCRRPACTQAKKC